VEPALLEALGYLPDLIDGQAPAAEPQDGPAPGSAPADRPQGSGGQD
jgi:hypothetical protein